MIIATWFPNVRSFGHPWGTCLWNVSVESLANILSGCPMLESLVLIYCPKLRHLDLSNSLKLTRLEIVSGLYLGTLKIVAPHIQYLKLIGSLEPCTLVDDGAKDARKVAKRRESYYWTNRPSGIYFQSLHTLVNSFPCGILSLCLSFVRFYLLPSFVVFLFPYSRLNLWLLQRWLFALLFLP